MPDWPLAFILTRSSRCEPSRSHRHSGRSTQPLDHLEALKDYICAEPRLGRYTRGTVEGWRLAWVGAGGCGEEEVIVSSQVGEGGESAEMDGER